MRAPACGNRSGVSFQMTPMIDVVFLLIIFFLVSSHLAQQETQIELDLPVAQTGYRSREDDARRLIVNVLAQGRIVAGGKQVAATDLWRMINVEKRRAEGRLEVRIRTDRHVPYRHVEPILLACAKAGVWQVSFAVLEHDRAGGG